MSCVEGVGDLGHIVLDFADQYYTIDRSARKAFEADVLNFVAFFERAEEPVYSRAYFARKHELFNEKFERGDLK